ncbi:MAG: DEAD/DEAH box helicase [Planctomycetota bacterium]|nr:MAG: DEAD/DEAH box helicase [Planctomycetota bacterium]
MITDYHIKYFANELRKRCSSDSLEKLTSALMDAQVDLNPHQIEAALFAFRSPLSKGGILADEVGLGKTIEAGIVLSQKWAERKRKVLIIVPSSLRKQWYQELQDKFFLPSHILEARSFNSAIKKGKSNPFDRRDIIICSYHFARNKSEFVVPIKWDLVVIDEAHRLRNVYKSSNKIARTLKETLHNCPKILLTATPLQNSLLELYGLVSFVDDYAFGDIRSFRSQYTRLTDEGTYSELKSRLAPICKRTLRRQVLEYIRYTNRIPITQEFIPTKDEQVLYELVSEYLQRDKLQALPSSQRTLMTLVMRKLLASSTFAIAGALDSLIRKLKARLKDNEKAIQEAEEEFEEDFESLDELQDEWEETDEDVELLTEEEIQVIESEIKDLEAFRDLAVSITENAKGKSLLTALEIGFKKAQELGAAKKTIIFTESRRTQNYLFELLSGTEYAGEIALFNGSNNDPKSKEIYLAWKEQNKDTDRATGSRSTDIRTALVDYFKNEAHIMIATEAAAEGINLQFCSLVVNYDLPWNPQRIEQRIGRCHRYGQEHDVVVVNFLNKKNEADQRVYELLSEKFKLFSGVFGASDEVLGSIESGVDFEKRIVEIYQNCRTSEEIQQSFDKLQEELSTQIDENVQMTRQRLLENFDEEVHEKLRVNLKESEIYLNKHENMLWQLTRYMLDSHAEFDGDQHSFMLKSNPYPELKVPVGPYRIGRHIEDSHIYRPSHPLASRIIKEAASKKLEPCKLVFDYSNGPVKISILEPLVGKSGQLCLYKLTIEALEAEDYLIFVAVSDEGKRLDKDQCTRLFSLSAKVTDGPQPAIDSKKLSELYKKQKSQILDDVSQRNAVFFDEEMDKLDHWATDQQKSLRTNLKELDDQIKELKRQIRQSNALPDKIALQKKVKAIEKRRDEAWRNYDQAAREVEKKKDELIDTVEARLSQNIIEDELFAVEWELK